MQIPPDLEIGGEERVGSSRTRSTPGYQVRVLAASPQQLGEAFHLRYVVYRQLGYIPAGGVELDVDEYDARALPLGVFEETTQELVGTLRVIRLELLPAYWGAIKHVLDQAGDAGLRARAERRSLTFPSVTSPEVGQRISALAGALPICELSRLIVHPGYRGNGLSRVLIEAGMSLAWSLGPALLVGGCLSEHVPMYARYGFRLLREDTGLEYFVSVGRAAHVLACSPVDVPEPTKSRIDNMIWNTSGGECHARCAASIAG